MHLSTALVASIALLLGSVKAGWEVRGPEILQFYYAYRMDVDVSSADGSDDSWDLANKCIPQEGDFPDGKIPTNKKGCNFAGFIRHVAKSNNNILRDDAKTKIGNLWEPELSEVMDIAKWPPWTEKSDFYTYEGFDPKNILGKANAKPDGKANEPYFEFDNMLAVIGKRMETLFEKSAAIAGPHYSRVIDAMDWAAFGRKKEQAGFMLSSVEKQLKKINPSAKGFIVPKGIKAKYGYAAYKTLDVSGTIAALKLNAKDKKAATTLLNSFTADYKAGKFSGQDETHNKVIDQEKKLSKVMGSKLGGAAKDKCVFPDVSDLPTPSTRK